MPNLRSTIKNHVKKIQKSLKSEGLIEKVIAEKLVDAPYNINKKDQSPVRQKPPSTLNLQESNNKVDSLISTSSQNNSPMPKENRDSNPRSASPSKQMNSPRRRKKKTFFCIMV